MIKEKNTHLKNNNFDEAIYHTLFGCLKLQANDEHLLLCTWLNKPIKELKPKNVVLKETISQLNAYFSKNLKTFDLPLQLKGSPFQKSVWEILQQIPFGQTLSYKALAEKVNKPKAFRAVGTANAKNPIAIIVPCHRVIRASGEIGGYAGGITCKQLLLSLENS